MGLDFKQGAFKFMLQNYEAVAKKMPSDFKSIHWDAFPNGYSDIIKNEEIWPRMLRNALTIGLKCALMSISKNRFKTGIVDLWKEMKQGDFPDLIKEENDLNSIKFMTEKVKKLIYSTDVEYVAANCIGEIGNPVNYNINVKSEVSKNYKVRYNETNLKM